MSSTGGERRLLVRDLAQLATPAGTAAPLRGQALGEVDVLEDAYVLCAGESIEAVGRMRDLAARSTATSRRSTDAVSARSRGSSTVTRTRASRATASRSSRCVPPARRYEELHAAGGGIMSTVRATREAGEQALADAVRKHRGWMLRAGTTTFESKSGYGLDRETELASLRAVKAAGGVPTWLGAHAVPPEFDDADAYLDFALAEVLPAAARDRGGRGHLPRARCVRRRTGAPLSHGLPRAGLALRLHGDQFTEQGAVPLAIELGARSVDHLEATGHEGVAALGSERRRRRAAAGERALPRAADAAGAGARRSGSDRRPRNRLQSRAAPSAKACRSCARSPPRSSGSRPRRRSPPARSMPRTCSAGRTGAAGSLRATTRTSSCSTRLTGGTSRTTSGRISWPRWFSTGAACGVRLGEHADQEAEAPSPEGSPPRVRVRLPRRRGQRGPRRRRPSCAPRRTASATSKPRKAQREGSRRERRAAAPEDRASVLAARRQARAALRAVILVVAMILLNRASRSRSRSSPRSS